MTRLILVAAHSMAHPYDREGRLTMVAQEDRAKATSEMSGVGLLTTEENEKTRPKCSFPAEVLSLAVTRVKRIEKQHMLSFCLCFISLSDLLCLNACLLFFLPITTPLRPFTTPSRFVHTLSYHPCMTVLVLFYIMFCELICSDQVLIIICWSVWSAIRNLLDLRDSKCRVIFRAVLDHSSDLSLDKNIH
jgi:hypothetical protein